MPTVSTSSGTARAAARLHTATKGEVRRGVRGAEVLGDDVFETVSAPVEETVHAGTGLRRNNKKCKHGEGAGGRAKRGGNNRGIQWRTIRENWKG